MDEETMKIFVIVFFALCFIGIIISHINNKKLQKEEKNMD